MSSIYENIRGASLLNGVIALSALAITSLIFTNYPILLSILGGLGLSIAFVLKILTYSIPSQSVGPEVQGLAMGARAFVIAFVPAVLMLLSFLTSQLQNIIGGRSQLACALILAIILGFSIYLANRSGFLTSDKSV